MDIGWPLCDQSLTIRLASVDLMCVIEIDGQVVGNIGGRRCRPGTLGPKNGFELEGTERAAVLGRDGSWLDDCTLDHL